MTEAVGEVMQSKCADERGHGQGPKRAPNDCKLLSSIATMTMSAGGFSAPRNRKSMFNDAADSEGTNQVTKTTSIMLTARIAGALMDLELFRIVIFGRGFERSFRRSTFQITINRSAVYAQMLSRAGFIAAGF